MAMRFWIGVGVVGLSASVASANVFHNYENFTEGFLGTSLYHDGVTYHDVNGVSGVFPDGGTFDPSDIGDQLIIEKATFLYNDFPGYGSPNKAMTFGTTFIPGDNLSIGALATTWMDLDQKANAASMDLAYYENGPWGGIEWHLDALLNGSVVASDTLVISNLGGRDNPTFTTLTVSGVEFDSLHLYAQFDGEYSAPRGIIDDLTITSVPEPASLALLGALSALALRRRG